MLGPISVVGPRQNEEPPINWIIELFHVTAEQESWYYTHPP